MPRKPHWASRIGRPAHHAIARVEMALANRRAWASTSRGGDRPDHEVGRFERHEQGWQVRRIVLTVRVHRHDGLDPLVECEDVPEPSDERRALAGVPRVPNDMIGTGRCRCRRGAVTRAIVDDDHDERSARIDEHQHNGGDGVRCLIGRNHTRRAQHQLALATGVVNCRRISRSSVSIPCQVATSSASRAIGRNSPALRKSSSRRLAPSIVYFSV